MVPSSSQSGRKHIPAKALEGGRKTAKAAATAKIDTAELSFMCSIVLFIFGLLPYKNSFLLLSSFFSFVIAGRFIFLVIAGLDPAIQVK